MRSFYIDSRAGSDSNNGLSAESPLRTLSAAGRLGLLPGDSLLLRRGSVFSSEALQLENLGKVGFEPVTVDCYGEGHRPVIDCNGEGLWYQDYGCLLDNPAHVNKGTVSSAIRLSDCENIIIRNIEITNYAGSLSAEEYSAPDRLERTGVSVTARNRGELTDITLENLFIHDVSGNVYDKHMNNGGIYASCLKPEDEAKTSVPRFRNFTVRHCTVVNVSRWGIAIGYTYAHRPFAGTDISPETMQEYGHHGIVISDCLVANAGGDGITVFYADKPEVIRCEAHSCASEMNDRIYRYSGARMGKVAAGIWSWKCKDALFTSNLVTGMRLNQDAMAWDADSGDSTIYTGNFSWGNEGGCVMFCLEEAVHSVFEDNISFDDLGGLFSSSQCPDGELCHNAFYRRSHVPFIRGNMGGGTYHAYDNEFTDIGTGEVPEEITGYLK